MNKCKPAVYLGLDIGASAAKAIIIDCESVIRGMACVPTGMDFVESGRTAVELALSNAGIKFSDIKCSAATGYGRKNVDFICFSKTEISCHALGAYHFFPEPIIVVDIGGQDNKIIRIGADGRILDFKMNRKCAAGTGAFLEEIAHRMDVGIHELNNLAMQSTVDVEIGSFCTVFSFTEIIAMTRRGVKKTDIAKAVFRSIVKRLTEMDNLLGKIVATGGVAAHNPMIIRLLAEACNGTILTPPQPQFAGALGAALFAVKENQ